MIFLSLCLPTNGISEWVFPVLKQIYNQNVDEDFFEVIVTDNGSNAEFEKKMIDYVKEKKNLKYKKTDVYMFQNQIEALKLASGEYLKFLNHRSLMEQGSLMWIINLVKETMSDRPVIYLSNGALPYKTRQEYADFDGFVRGLRECASWTTGVGIWRKDFEKIPDDKEYSKISPHSDVLFAERKKEKYIIDNTVWSHEIDDSHINKGKYDLYKAFGVEEISITLQLFLDGDISAKTLKYIIRQYENCVASFYLEFSILHKPCSYILTGFNDSMGVFLNKRHVILRAYCKFPQVLFLNIYNFIKGVEKKSE